VEHSTETLWVKQRVVTGRLQLAGSQGINRMSLFNCSRLRPLRAAWPCKSSAAPAIPLAKVDAPA
jgi:hypothetical protein